MKIWFINHYAVPLQYYPLARPSSLAKNLIKMGHDVTIIAASTVHNSSKNLIDGYEKTKMIYDDGIPYCLIRCSGYQGNGIGRIINILQFAYRLPKVLDTLEKPDAIVATSFDPISCLEGIKYAKKHKIKAIAEIADLWPETLVVYTGISRSNPLVKYLRKVEKKIYTLSDSIVFTMEAACEYIKEQNWQTIIPEKKIFYINNGVDLESFDRNKLIYRIDDEDLHDPNTFKVIYTGSIRKVNDVGKLIDVAKTIATENIVFLIYGNGDQLDALRERVNEEKVPNVKIKGYVEKKYIPYIVSHADLNIIHGGSNATAKYGTSQNKMFDYFAAGKPIIRDTKATKDPIVSFSAGIETDSDSIEDIATGIREFYKMSIEEREKYCKNARKAAEFYDYKNLAKEMLKAIKA